MKVLCLTDFPVQPPDRWIWNHLDAVEDQADFLWAETSDRSGRLGKLVLRYPPFWRLALRALHQTATHDYDLIVAWESKTGIPLARIELLNVAQVKACNAYSKLSLPVCASWHS